MAALQDHMSDFVPHPTILQLKARSLRNESTPLRGRPTPTNTPKREDLDLSPLIDLYNKFDGDLDQIFGELGEDPNKAKKYPPTDGEDFANKYIMGSFTYVSNLEQIRGRAMGRAGGDKDIETVLEEHTPQEIPDDMLDEAAVHPIDVLKAMFPDIKEDAVVRVFEAAHGSLEDAAAALWFMKILQAFASSITTVSIGQDGVEVGVEEMTFSQLMSVAREEGVDVTSCLEKSEIVAAIKEHRANSK